MTREEQQGRLQHRSGVVWRL